MESEAHKEYVLNAIDYIKRTFHVDDSMIASDLGVAQKLPPKDIDGFRADVYVNTPDLIIIAEAKTDNDIVNNHTNAQLISYIKEVLAYNKERHIILSSSMAGYPSIRNVIRRLRKRFNITGINFHTVDPFKKGEILL
ncbi:MAG: hypothetical protein MRZ38_03505 [Muribaculaceae bacterium]|nr:hypothetical protein [Muribaculaceae bacterium]